MNAYRAACPCGESSSPMPSKPAARQWATDHNAMHEHLDERRPIVIEEVAV